MTFPGEWWWWCPGADYANSTNSMTYAKVGQSIFPYDHYAFWRECPTFRIEKRIALGG
jgi:hypothetical protein